MLAGCGQGSDTPAPASAPAPAAAPKAPSASAEPATSEIRKSGVAPVDYIASSVKAEQNMVKTVDLSALNENVQLFNVQEGRLPKSLDELVEKKYLGKLPYPPAGMKLAYDATTGKVTVVKE